MCPKGWLYVLCLEPMKRKMTENIRLNDTVSRNDRMPATKIDERLSEITFPLPTLIQIFFSSD